VNDTEPRAEANPYEPPAETSDIAEPVSTGTQVGGWMVLPMLGMLLTAAASLFSLVTDYAPMFAAGADWDVITDPGFADYHPLWAPLILFEMLTNFGYIALIAYGFWLVLRRSRRFVPVVICYLTAGVVVTSIDAYCASLIPALAQQGVLLGGDIGRSVVGAGIWIPYFLVSQRVKETFVNP
jgi:hypothetical protein